MGKLRVGFALCGSFCTFKETIAQMKRLAEEYDITPIMSYHAASLDSRFGKAEDFIAQIEMITQNKVLSTIPQVEPIGPKQLLDILVIAPCTGNSIAKIACGISDTPVTLAVKSHLRNERPVVIAVSTNDALSANAANIGTLMNRKHIYFVPFKQDNPAQKPNSMVADFSMIPQTIEAAMLGKQLQPIYL